METLVLTPERSSRSSIMTRSSADENGAAVERSRMRPTLFAAPHRFVDQRVGNLLCDKPFTLRCVAEDLLDRVLRPPEAPPMTRVDLLDDLEVVAVSISKGMRRRSGESRQGVNRCARWRLL
jgi:hypothetical protein